MHQLSLAYRHNNLDQVGPNLLEHNFKQGVFHKKLKMEKLGNYELQQTKSSDNEELIPSSEAFAPSPEITPKEAENSSCIQQRCMLVIVAIVAVLALFVAIIAIALAIALPMNMTNPALQEILVLNKQLMASTSAPYTDASLREELERIRETLQDSFKSLNTSFQTSLTTTSTLLQASLNTTSTSLQTSFDATSMSIENSSALTSTVVEDSMNSINTALERISTVIGENVQKLCMFG